MKLLYNRIRHWEYWPFEVVYLPVFLYYAWLSLRARSFFFFSASNPSIVTGGLIGESKYSILQNIPEEYRAYTVFIEKEASFGEVLEKIKAHGIAFPLIAKPDVGERGNRVEKIHSIAALQLYVTSIRQDFLIQEYINYPIELGIFYYRLPNERHGKVSSVVEKAFLEIMGNGVDTLGSLIRQHPRAAFQYERLKHTFDYTSIPSKNEMVLLEPIGNHCRGTTFLNANHLIDPVLTALFDRISSQIDGFYFGRYDLRCKSIMELKEGKHIKILELNGAGAEPAHIYQPGFPLIRAWKVLLHHWSMLYKISIMNHAKGVAYINFQEFKKVYKAHKSMN